MGPLFERFMALEASSVDDLCGNVKGAAGVGGHIPLFRAHPILRSRNGRAVVLDPVFLVEHASVGPLFLLSRGLPRTGRSTNDLFRRFGEAFELYVGDLIRRGYPESPLLASRASSKVRLHRRGHELGGMDGVVATGPREACLIEAKGVFLADRDGADGRAYLRELSTKYARLDDAPDERPKGVAQLGRFVAELGRGDLDEVPEVLRGVEVVLPVLVAHDHNIDSPGHGEFLMERFVTELQPDGAVAGGYSRKGSLIVGSPVLLSIDDIGVERRPAFATRDPVLPGISTKRVDGSMRLPRRP